MKRRDFLKSVTGVAAGAMVPAPAIWSAAKADARSETLLIVSEGGPNNLDIHGIGTNVPGYEVSWNCYDRLISHEMKSGPGGVPYYDRDKFKPELAEDMNIGDMSVTFKLKKNAKFQDGTQVTAKDVKWSLDRSVSVGGFPTFQMSAGSLTKPEQFVVVDDNTVRVDFLKKDRLTVPDLAVIVPCVINSELVKKNATEKDPWGLEYTKQQTAGSGAYKVTKWTAGTEVVMERNDAWVGGPMPKIKRVIWRMVPQAGNRRALLERGDADISYELPNKDFQELKAAGKLDIVSLPFSNGIQYLGMNVTKPPFDNPKVRQAVAYAVPYQKIMDAVLFGLANPMFGAPADKPTEVAWPQATKYFTDMAKAKALMTEAGYADGFETTISFDLNFAMRAGAGKPRPDRHQDHDQQGAGRQLANRIEQEGNAALHQRVLGLARLPRILLLLVLSRQQFRLQHHELQVAGDGQINRRRPQRRRDRRHAGLRYRRQGIRRSGVFRHSADSAVSALRQRRDAEEHLGLSILVPPPARLSRAGEGVSGRIANRE
jgi:peptide/nickel transport system substrate-binding protein